MLVITLFETEQLSLLQSTAKKTYTYFNQSDQSLKVRQLNFCSKKSQKMIANCQQTT